MAVYRVEFLKSAAKELSKLQKDIQVKIRDRIDALTLNPYPNDVKKLKNGNGRLRIRVNHYRVIYIIESNKLVVLIVKVGHRGDVYNE